MKEQIQNILLGIIIGSIISMITLWGFITALEKEIKYQIIEKCDYKILDITRL